MSSKRLRKLLNGSIFLAATILILTASSLLQPTVSVFGQIVPPQLGDYVVTEYSGGSLTKITPAGTKSAIANELNGPNGFTIDSQGNYIVAENDPGSLTKVTPSGAKLPIAVLTGPVGVAIDSQGNYIVTESGTGYLTEVTPSGTKSAIANGFSGPLGVDIDSQGNYIVTDMAGNLWKVTPSGVKSLIANGFIQPEGIAIDSEGNYIVVERGFGVVAGSLTKVTPSGVKSPIVANGFNTPVGVAIDSQGNYIIVEDGGGSLTKVTPSGVTSTIASGLSRPFGVAIYYPSSTSVATATGTGIATFQTSAGGFASLTAEAVSGSSPPPAGWTFPDGLFSFTITRLTAGQTVTVTVTLPSPVPDGSFTYWKIHGGAWIPMTSSKATLDSSRVVIILTLTDSASPDDADGSANGVIVDPGGPAIAQMPAHYNPVSGVVSPVNKLEILTPCLAVAGLIVAASTFVAVKRRSKN